MLDAFLLTIARIFKTKSARTFVAFIPNEKTIAAMKSARRGDVVTVGTLDELLVSLNEDS